MAEIMVAFVLIVLSAMCARGSFESLLRLRHYWRRCNKYKGDKKRKHLDKMLLWAMPTLFLPAIIISFASISSWLIINTLNKMMDFSGDETFYIILLFFMILAALIRCASYGQAPTNSNGYQ